MAIWPGTLPEAPLVNGATETAPDLVIRTQMDAGPAKVRRRFTAGVRKYSMQMLLTAAQVVTLDEFFLSTLDGGAERFDWVNPRTEAAAEFRFTGPPEYRPLGAGRYQASFELEEMP